MWSNYSGGRERLYNRIDMRDEQMKATTDKKRLMTVMENLVSVIQTTMYNSLDWIRKISNSYS